MANEAKVAGNEQRLRTPNALLRVRGARPQQDHLFEHYGGHREGNVGKELDAIGTTAKPGPGPGLRPSLSPSISLSLSLSHSPMPRLLADPTQG